MPTALRLFSSGSLAVAASALVLAGCGSDSSSTSDAASAPASSPASTSAQAEAGDSTSESGAAVDGKITVKATEFAFAPMDITAAAGKLEITLVNDGDAPHELVVLKTDAAADALQVSDGRVSEDDSVGEVEEVEGGETGTATLDLKPGRYVIVCNVPGHYMKGMRGTLTVS